MNEQIETNITDAEWEVMRVVWAQDNATSKYIIDVLEKKKLEARYDQDLHRKTSKERNANY